jgi:hypothetical protein
LILSKANPEKKPVPLCQTNALHRTQDFSACKRCIVLKTFEDAEGNKVRQQVTVRDVCAIPFLAQYKIKEGQDPPPLANAATAKMHRGL